jgi:hypothetical protein
MPDGKSLIYGAYPGGEGFLFTIRPAGNNNIKRLEIASRGATSPAVARKDGRFEERPRLPWRERVAGSLSNATYPIQTSGEPTA